MAMVAGVSDRRMDAYNKNCSGIGVDGEIINVKKT